MFVHWSSPFLGVGVAWDCGFARVLLAEESFEDIQTLGPEPLVEAQPLMGAGERSGVEAAEMRAATHLAADQSRHSPAP